MHTITHEYTINDISTFEKEDNNFSTAFIPLGFKVEGQHLLLCMQHLNHVVHYLVMQTLSCIGYLERLVSFSSSTQTIRNSMSLCHPKL